MNTIEYSTDENVPGHINAEFAKMRKDAERQKEASKAAGRYTLEEAANLLEKEAGERAGPMLDKLKAAAASRALPTYEPGKNARYAGKVVREFYEEAHAEDLNAWLEANEPRIVWRFTLGSLSPGAIATMREMGWSEARIEAERQAAERIRAAGGFPEYVRKAETARLFSEAVGFTCAPEHIERTPYESHAEWLTAHGPSWDAPVPPMWWADALATETAERQGWAGMRGEEMRVVARANNSRTLEAASADLPLLQWPDVAPWPKGQPLPDNWREGLFMRKSDLREWAKTHAPQWLGSALLAEPKSAPAAEAARIAGPGTMRHSTKGKRAQPLSAEIEAAKREATNPDDAHAVYAVLQRWADERKAPFLGFVQGEGCKYQTPDGVEFFTLAALRKRMNRAAKTR